VSLTTQQELVACLIATSGKPLKDIAKQIGTTTEQLKRWLKDPDFAERVLLEKEDYLEQIRRVGIASRIHRIRNYNEIFDRLDSAIRAREKDHPSGVMRKNKDGELIIDGKLLSEIREYMKAMATEVGDLDELPTDTTPKKVLIGIPIDAI
jgi:hypothetical protein